MAKKSKSKKKSKEVDPKEKERLELLERAVALRGDTEKEKALDTQYHAQSDSLKQFWDIEKKLRDERKHQLSEKEQYLQQIKNEHIVHLGEYKRTIKQLLVSNQDEQSQIAIQSLLGYQSQAKEYQREMKSLFDELSVATRAIEQTTSKHQNLKNSLHHEFSEEVTALRENASRVISRLAAHTSTQLKKEHEEFELKLGKEIQHLEMQNEIEIKDTIEKNAQQMQSMRRQSNAAINSNLDIITDLTKELVMLREQCRKDVSVLKELQSDNDGIMNPLETNSNDLIRLRSDLDVFYRQKKELETRRKQLKQAEKELNDIKWEHEVLFQHQERIEQQCRECKETYRDQLYSKQQKTNMANMKLERKLDLMTVEGEKNSAVLSQVLIQSNVDLASVDQAIVSDIVAEKNNKIKMLNDELSRIMDAHTIMMKRYHSLTNKPIEK